MDMHVKCKNNLLRGAPSLLTRVRISRTSAPRFVVCIVSQFCNFYEILEGKATSFAEKYPNVGAPQDFLGRLVNSLISIHPLLLPHSLYVLFDQKNVHEHPKNSSTQSSLSPKI